jgi:rubredoxin-NAD+ reductase
MNSMHAENQRIDWYRTKVEPAVLARLSRPEDWRAWHQAGGHVLLAGLTGLVTILVGFTCPIYLFFLCLLIHGAIVNCMVAGEHELVHERVFKTPFLNRLFVNIVSFLTFENHRLFWLSHNEHHKFTLHPPDDLEQVLPQKVTPLQLSVYILFDYTSFARRMLDNIYLAFGRPRGEWQKYLFERSDARTIRQVCNFSRFLLITHALILFGCLYFGLWMVPLVVSFSWMFGSLFFYLMALPQHIGLVDEINDFRLSCRTYRQNAFFEFLYWRMNYHTEHHMYPAVPCYNLGRLHDVIKHEMPHCPNGLMETWVQIADILIKQKYDPSYQYRPQLPTDPPDALTALIGRTGIPPAEQIRTEVAKVWECQLCGFIYDEREGLVAENIAPGTRWEDIPDDWVCPVCGVAKSMFKMVEITREIAATKARLAIDSFAEPIVIVGSGIAGYSLAREIRKINPDLPITIVTRDAGESYYKPNISNALQLGKTADQLIHSNAKTMAHRLKIDVLAETAVESVDPARKCLQTSRGEIHYHKLVLAVGADPIKLPLQGSGANCVLRVNNLPDYRVFCERLTPGASVLIIGAGLIGCEFANDLALSGYAVRVVDVAPVPLSRFLPVQLGNVLKQELERVGVRWCLEDAVRSIEHGRGKRLLVTTMGNACYEVDLVLSAVGLRPQIELAQAAGLSVDQGIRVNEYLQTSDPNIYAIGDCMEFAEQIQPFVLPIQRAVGALARSLNGDPAAVEFSVMPVEAKTPSCPVIVVAPKRNTVGVWHLDGNAPDLIARFIDSSGKLCGMVLMGKMADPKHCELDRIEALPASRSEESSYVVQA